MRTGISLGTGLPLDSYPRLARLIEDLGFDQISIQDNLSQRGAWLIASIVAAHTSRVEIGPGVVSPFVDHPVRVASEIGTLQQLSEGRAGLGIGRGSLFEMIGLQPPSDPQALAEALQVIHYLTSGGRGGVTGRYFSVAPSFSFGWLAATPPPRLWAGTSGPRTLRAVAPHVDTVSMAGLWQARQAAAFRAMLDDRVRLGASVWTVLDRDRPRGVALARRHVALRIPFMRAFALDAGVPAAELSAIGERLQSAGLDAATEAVTEPTAEAFCAIGGVDELVAGVRALAKAGVSQISFGGPFGGDVEGTIRTIGEQVLPNLPS